MVLYAGSVSAAVTANDNAFHAANSVFNGSSSILMVDGSDTTGLVAGAGSIANPISVGDDGGGASFMTGYVAEVGIWSTAFSGTNRTNINSNQHSYWGF